MQLTYLPCSPSFTLLQLQNPSFLMAGRLSHCRKQNASLTGKGQKWVHLLPSFSSCKSYPVHTKKPHLVAFAFVLNCCNQKSSFTFSSLSQVRLASSHWWSSDTNLFFSLWAQTIYRMTQKRGIWILPSSLSSLEHWREQFLRCLFSANVV